MYRLDGGKVALYCREDRSDEVFLVGPCRKAEAYFYAYYRTGQGKQTADAHFRPIVATLFFCDIAEVSSHAFS